MVLVSDYEEPRPTAATVRRAEAGQTAYGGTSLPIVHFSTPEKGCQGIAALLAPGKANGVKTGELAERLGIDERTLRRRIQIERQTGSLILSDTVHGYFTPFSADDVRKFIKSMRHRCSEIAAVTQAAEVELARMEGQEMLEGW